MRGIERLLLVAIFLSSLMVLASAQPVKGGEWTSFILNYNNTRYQPNSTINSSNLANLVQQWQFKTQDAVSSTPVVSNGSVYFGDWSGEVYSVNVLHGTLNWNRNLGNAISSTLEVYNGTIYVPVGPATNYMYALSQKNGTILWSNTIKSTSKQIWASPTIYNGMIYIGVTGDGQNETNISTIGGIYALNARTGVVVWNFNTTVGHTGGDGVWGSVAVDPNLNAVYFGTGNPYNVSVPGVSQLYGYSIMSMNATNGKLNWYYQAFNSFTEEGGDYDFGSTPNLFSLSVNGVAYNAVGLGNKNGVYYILNRTNGKPIENLTIGSLGLSGIIGLAGLTYPTSSTQNPELFIPSFYNTSPQPTFEGGVVKAIYPSNRSVAWQFFTPGNLDGSVALVPGAVLFGDDLGNFYALNMSNGKILFQTQADNSILAGVTVAEGYVFVPVFSGSGPNSAGAAGVYAFNSPVRLSVSLNATVPLTGQNEVLTATSANGGTSSNAYTFYFVDPTPSNIPITGCSGVSGGTSVTCTFIATNGSYTYGVGVSNGSQTANSAAIVVNVLDSSTSVTTTSTTSTSTSSTTTTGGGGGGGGGGGSTGGGGGGGGSGSAKPIITNQTNGFTVNGIAQLGNFGNVFCGQIFHVTDNYITPNYTGVTINNKIYTLYLNQPVALNASAHCYVELLNVSYLPILQSVKLEFFTNKTTATSALSTTSNAVAKTNSTTSSSSTTINKTTSILVTTIAQAIAPARQTPPTNQTNSSNQTASGSLASTHKNPFSAKNIAIAVIGFVIVIAAVALLLGRRGGKSWSYKVDDKYTYNSNEPSAPTDGSQSPSSKVDWKS